MSRLLSLYGLAGGMAKPWLRRMLKTRLDKGKEDPNRIGERFGQTSLPRPAGRLVWLHAASVGETLSILPVIEALAAQCEILLTTGTLTSAGLAGKRLPPRARHQFVPLDVPAWIDPFLAHWRPNAAVFVESELWPSTIAALDARSIPRLLINARLSARSTRRWRLLPGLAQKLLGGFRQIHAQSALDAANLTSLGIRGALVWGNLKLATPLLPAAAADLALLRRQIPGPTWLAASTHPGEEEILLAAHRLLLGDRRDLITIIVPRHPERGGEIRQLAPDLPVSQRSKGELPRPGGIYIADTLGELGLFYRIAPFAFIGGSLVPHGGQNVIEPARLGIPVLTGPHTGNFAEPVRLLKQAGALQEVHDAPGLAAAIGHWLDHPAAAGMAGRKAAATFTAMADLPGRIATLILDTIDKDASDESA